MEFEQPAGTPPKDLRILMFTPKDEESSAVFGIGADGHATIGVSIAPSISISSQIPRTGSHLWKVPSRGSRSFCPVVRMCSSIFRRRCPDEYAAVSNR
jgi:hypothetical protein